MCWKHQASIGSQRLCLPCLAISPLASARPSLGLGILLSQQWSLVRPCFSVFFLPQHPPEILSLTPSCDRVPAARTPGDMGPEFRATTGIPDGPLREHNPVTVPVLNGPPPCPASCSQVAWLLSSFLHKGAKGRLRWPPVSRRNLLNT